MGKTHRAQPLVRGVPIVQRFEIIGAPKARDVFSADVWTRLFQSQNAGLRRLDDEAQAQIADLEIRELEAPNFWIAVEQEILAAELSDVSKENLTLMERDLRAALEGETAERKVKLIRRAAKLADDFAKWRAKQGTLHCDDCKFDPATRPPCRYQAALVSRRAPQEPFGRGKAADDTGRLGATLPDLPQNRTPSLATAQQIASGLAVGYEQRPMITVNHGRKYDEN